MGRKLTGATSIPVGLCVKTARRKLEDARACGHRVLKDSGLSRTLENALENVPQNLQAICACPC